MREEGCPQGVIEDKVVEDCRKLLTDDNIKRIVEAIDTVCRTEYDSSTVKRFKAAAALEAQLAVEAKKERVLSAKQVSHSLMLLKAGDINDAFNRRSLVNKTRSPSSMIASR